MAQQTRLGSRCLVAVALLAGGVAPALAFAPPGMLAGASRALAGGAGRPIALVAARLGGDTRRATLGGSFRSFGAAPRSWHRARCSRARSRRPAACWPCGSMQAMRAARACILCVRTACMQAANVSRLVGRLAVA
jgi:hypothetical protein